MIKGTIFPRTYYVYFHPFPPTDVMSTFVHACSSLHIMLHLPLFSFWHINASAHSHPRPSLSLSPNKVSYLNVPNTPLSVLPLKRERACSESRNHTWQLQTFNMQGMGFFACFLFLGTKHLTRCFPDIEEMFVRSRAADAACTELLYRLFEVVLFGCPECPLRYQSIELLLGIMRKSVTSRHLNCKLQSLRKVVNLLISLEMSKADCVEG